MTRQLLPLALLLAAPAAAQQLRVGVAPDTITVGSLARVAIRIELPAEHRALFPDTLPVAGDVENAGRRRTTARPLPGGAREITAIYTLTAWRPGEVPLPPLPVTIVGPAERRTLETRLPSLFVASVLPEDTAGIEPMPPKDVLGENWLVWPLVLAAAGALALAAAVLYALRRRRPPAPVPASLLRSPRERALEALDAARDAGLVEAGELKAFYSRVTEAVRHFVADLNGAWGADLASSELLARMDGEAEPQTAQRLARLLGSADLVKFARRRPLPEEAMADWAVARAWVESFYWSPPEPEAEEAASDEPEPVASMARGPASGAEP